MWRHIRNGDDAAVDVDDDGDVGRGVGGGRALVGARGDGREGGQVLVSLDEKDAGKNRV